jgi:hypothetical protein
MNKPSGLKAMSAFAAEHGIGRGTVADVVAIHDLPYETIGPAKGLPPETQEAIIKILGIKPKRNVPVTAN